MCNNLCFVFMLEYNMFGGGETYYIRMADELSTRGIDSFLLYPQKSSINKTFEHELNRLDVQIIRISENKKKHTAFQSIFKKYKRAIAVLFTKSCFIKTDELMRAVGIPYNIFLYIIWPGDACLKRNNIFWRIALRFFMMPMVKNRNIVAFDDETMKVVTKYSIIDQKRIPIVKLGLKLKTFGQDYYESKNNYDAFNILTVCRFDFPFKGYVIGLIQDFCFLHAKYKNMKLTIVGDGDGKDYIDKVLARQPLEACTNIIFKGFLSPEQLEHEYSSANVYVGMGTTIIDAVQHGRVAIVATVNSYSNLSTGYFGQTNNIGISTEGRFAKYQDPITNLYTFYELIEKIYKSSNTEYKALVEDSNNLLKEYNIKNVMDFFLDETIGAPCNSNLARNIIIQLLKAKI